NLRIGVADGLIDGLRHHRAAIDLLEMAHRHLAGPKTIEADLVLHVDETGVRLGIEIRCGNADLEFVFQSLDEGFCDLHGVDLLPAFVRPEGTDLSICRGAALKPAPVVGGPNLSEMVLR